MRRIGRGYERSQPSRWPLFGMLALGLVAGAAAGGYAVSQRWRLQQLPELAHRVRVLRTGRPMREEGEATVVTVPGSNLRRKATSEA